MITVRKPTDTEIAEMQKLPIWSCEVSTFDWSYSSKEICLIIKGEVTVSYDGGEVSFGAGDYVEFTKGLNCVWNVKKNVEKHYKFE